MSEDQRRLLQKPLPQRLRQMAYESRPQSDEPGRFPRIQEASDLLGVLDALNPWKVVSEFDVTISQSIHRFVLGDPGCEEGGRGLEREAIDRVIVPKGDGSIRQEARRETEREAGPRRLPPAVPTAPRRQSDHIGDRRTH